MSDAMNISSSPATIGVQARDSTTRLLLVCGVIGPILFTAVYLLEGTTRPGYDPWLQAVSALSLSG